MKYSSELAFARLRHDRLADVDDFRGIRSEAVDAQDFQRLAVKEQLEHAHGVARDLGPGQALEQRVADLVGDLVFGQFALVLPNELISGVV